MTKPSKPTELSEDELDDVTGGIASSGSGFAKASKKGILFFDEADSLHSGKPKGKET